MLVPLALPLSAHAQALEENADQQELGPGAGRVDEAVHVRLAFEGCPDVLAEDVAGDLRASLRERGIGMILGDLEDRSALATVRVDATEYATGRLRIVVEDALTRKLVERAVQLADEPPDVWSVLIAAAADELLRASWAELSLRDAPTPTREVPQAVQAALASSLASSSEPRTGDGTLGFGADVTLVFSEHASFLGARLLISEASLAPLTLRFAIGVSGLLPGASERARFEALWLFGDLEAGVALLPRQGDVRLLVVVGARAGAVFASATTQSVLLRAHTDTAPALLLDGGFRGALTLGASVQLTLGVLVGAPLLGFSLSDGERDVVSFSGLTVRAELGFEVWL